MKKTNTGKLLNLTLAFMIVMFLASFIAFQTGLNVWLTAACLGGIAYIMPALAPDVLAVAILPTTALQKINLMTEDAWSTNQRAIENEVEADSLQKQIQKQEKLGKSFITPLTDPKKDHNDVKVMWIDFCGESAEDCSVDNYCDGIDGAVPGVQFKDYNLSQCITDDFKLSESTFAGSSADMQEFIVKNQVRKITNLLNLLNKKYLLFLHANAGFNRGATYAPNVSAQAQVPAAKYSSADLITDMIIDARISKVQRPFGLSGRNLYKTYLNADLDSDDTKGQINRARQLDITFDIFGFANAGGAIVDSTFLVTPYAAAFVNKNFYQSSVPVFDPTTKMDKYYITIPAFGIRVDVLHQRICEDAKKDRFAHVWKYTLHYDFLTNPFGCADANGKIVTGILEYTKVA